MNDWAYFRELFNIFRKLSLVEGMVSTSKLIFKRITMARFMGAATQSEGTHTSHPHR
jgi:hypothetical protein